MADVKISDLAADSSPENTALIEIETAGGLSRKITLAQVLEANEITAYGLRSATTVVSVSAATAPSSGQVLTATSGTAATWQTPSGGGTPAGSSGQFQFNDASAFGGANLWREGANTIAQRNSTSAQTHYFYKTTDGGSNYARIEILAGSADSPSLQIIGRKAGTGTYANFDIGWSNTKLLRQDGTNATLYGQHFLTSVSNTYDIGSSGTPWRSGYFGTLLVSPLVRTTATVVGSLTAAATAGAGARAFVTDANATTFASIVAGGGSNGVPVYSDGTNWRIG